MEGVYNPKKVRKVGKTGRSIANDITNSLADITNSLAKKVRKIGKNQDVVAFT